jgi:hypothetical protein
MPTSLGKVLLSFPVFVMYWTYQISLGKVLLAIRSVAFPEFRNVLDMPAFLGLSIVIRCMTFPVR